MPPHSEAHPIHPLAWPTTSNRGGNPPTAHHLFYKDTSGDTGADQKGQRPPAVATSDVANANGEEVSPQWLLIG